MSIKLKVNLLLVKRSSKAKRFLSINYNYHAKGNKK